MLMDEYLDKFKVEYLEENGEEAKITPKILFKFKEAARKLKHELAAANCDLADFETESPDFCREVTREDFARITKSFIDKITEPIDALLARTKLTPSKFSKIFLCGGCTRIPIVQEKLTAYFQDPAKMEFVENPEEAVALGAAWVAFARANPEQTLQIQFIGKDEEEKKAVVDVPKKQTYPAMFAYRRSKKWRNKLFIVERDAPYVCTTYENASFNFLFSDIVQV